MRAEATRRASERTALLESNRELRKDRRTFQAPDVDSGHLAFRIPPGDFVRHAYGELLHIDELAQKAYMRRPKYPGLVSDDPLEAAKEMRRLLRDHPEYKINPTEGRRMPTDGVIVR